MRGFTWSALVGTACLLVAIPAEAQLCRGDAPISKRAPVMVGGITQFWEGDATYLAGSFGGDGDGAFVRVDVGSIISDLDGRDVSSLVVDSTFGGQYYASRRVSICPTFMLDNEWVNDIAGSDIDLWSLTVGGGGTIGVVAVDIPRPQVVPSFGVFGLRQRAKLSGADDTAVFNDTYAVIAAGIGLIMNDRFSITPAGILATGLDEGTTKAFRVTFSVNFPR